MSLAWAATTPRRRTSSTGAFHLKLHEFTTTAAAGKGGAPVPDVGSVSFAQWACNVRVEDRRCAPGIELTDSTQLTMMLI